VPALRLLHSASLNRIVAIVSLLVFLLGAAALSLTLYLWFGDWPAEIKEIVDYERSRAATELMTPPPLVANVNDRRSTSLDGTWKALVDPNESILGRMFGAIPRHVRPESPSDLIEFSFEDGLELDVPGDWNTQDERLYFYRGAIWYKRTFDFERQPGRRYFLHFGAANYEASVYLNGIRVGRHVGGFSPFNFEVGKNLRDGENLLIVLVNNDHTKQDIPTKSTDRTNYGGLTRSVRLLDLPETFIQGHHIQLAQGSRERIAGWVQLDGPKSRQEITLSIPELGLEEKLSSNGEGRAEFDVEVAPELWSPESPKLYRVELRAESDSVSEEIGFRSIEVSGTDILLNGEPIFLRGVSIHEEAGKGRGRAFAREHADLLLGWARELECNFVRLAHYPHNEAMVRAADRMGFLVWSEIPVYWNLAFDDPYTIALGRQQIGEMIERDRNRASVIIWSLGNETPITPARNAFMKGLAGHVRSLDDTRLVSAAILTGIEIVAPVLAKGLIPAALLGPGHGEWKMEVDMDPLSEIVDIPAVNEYWGWYYSGIVASMMPFTAKEARQAVLDNISRLQITTRYDKPMIASEFGAGAKAGMHAEDADLVVFSEEYQARVYRAQLEMLSKQEKIRGLSPWILKDFRSHMRLYQGLQDYWNLKGLVSDSGEKKLAFGVLRDHYAARVSESARMPGRDAGTTSAGAAN
jgi:beta-glucuronidase